MARFKTTILALAFALAVLALGVRAAAGEPAKPTLFLIGDSTVKNGMHGHVGWGTPIVALFDPARISVQNRALAGRSSRSFLREGLWENVRAQLAPGDFVIMHFGHNDGGSPGEAKARASLAGTGDEAREVTVEGTDRKEIVRTYGWYLRKYIADTKERGATPIVCSLVPRNVWHDGKVVRAVDSHAQWAREAANQAGAFFIDLHELAALRYEAAGPEKVRAEYFTAADHTHTTQKGAELNAACVVEALRNLETCPLAGFLSSKAAPSAPAH
jgi:lysophospholipase L1-like esterase